MASGVLMEKLSKKGPSIFQKKSQRAKEAETAYPALFVSEFSHKQTVNFCWKDYGPHLVKYMNSKESLSESMNNAAQP